MLIAGIKSHEHTYNGGAGPKLMLFHDKSP